MGFFNSFGFNFYGVKGTTSDTPPLSASGLTRIKNLSNSAIQSSTQTQQVQTYDIETLGWSRGIPVENSYTIDCTLNIDTQEASYKLLKECARDSSAGVLLRWFRETPLAASSGVGAVEFLTITNPSGGGTPGALNNLATTTTGDGTGLLVDLTIAGSGSASLAVPDSANKGTGYSIGDLITIAAVNATTTGPVNAIVQAISGTGTKERHSGLAFVTNFSESIEAGSVAACTFQLSGYGNYIFFPAV
jgi:hypothetical protein